MASLLHLPNELSAVILSQVHPRDWLSLGRTCKELRTKTAHLVTDFFFRKRVVMIERRSLHCLESIAGTASLGKFVEELDICTSHLLPLDEVEDIEPPDDEYEGMMKYLMQKNDPDAILDLGLKSDYEQWIRRWPINNGEDEFSDEDEQDDHYGQDGQPTDRAVSEDDKVAKSRLEQINTQEYNRYRHDQDDMMRTSHDVKCLARAMRNLVGCRKINISTSIHAWGLRRLRKQIGILPQRALTFKSSASIRQVHHIVQVVLAAIAVSGIAVQCLDIEPGTSVENANRISPSMLLGPSSSVILSHHFPTSLRQLQISLDPGSLPDNTAPSRAWGQDFIQFVSLLPELSTLDLGFECRDEEGRFSEIAKELYIPQLKSITLYMVDTTKEDIAIFLLSHHRTLRTVVLNSIRLEGDLSAWRWLVTTIWRSLDLDEFSILSSWVAEKDGNFASSDIQDITITDSASYSEAVQALE
ncbi:unnamed protein product [Fusarium graminearum]|uniref:Uncharacterized protein n=1 Tax=Gibberella zeae TaxID=5518 RepID=A0A4U9F7V5_GIBZA|nr:unnamed protein product [Fusarium graminearum]